MVTEQDRRPTHHLLDEAECLSFLTSTTVGRVAFLGSQGVVLRPVNFRMVAGDLFFRVSAGGALGEVVDAGREVLFEIDHHGTNDQAGWSVLVRGTCTSGERPEVLDHEDVRHPVPWGATGPTVLVSLHPVSVTGRTVRLATAPA